MNAKPWFVAVVAVQMAFLVGETAMYERRLNAGRELILQVRPVDPRSLFSGNYMALRLDASDLDTSRILAPMDLRPGETVYVTFYPDTPYARPGSLSRTMGSDPAFTRLRGRVVSRSGSHLSVDYGIERYYIPETRQDEVNRLWWSRHPRWVGARLRVDRHGGALIERILVDGKPLPY